jgi:MFS family permease
VSQRAGVWWPWLVAVGGLGVLCVSNGLVISGITAFDESLLAEFNWQRGELKLRDLITLVGTGLAAPFAGALVDRFGPRPLLLAGSLLLASGYLAYAQVQALWQVYMIHAGFALALVCCGVNVAVIMVSRWFHARRGLALGIVVVGTSVGGMLLTPIFSDLIAAHGWRGAFRLAALTPLALWPIALWLARAPADRSHAPLGEAAALAPADPHWQRALTTPAFWTLAAIAGLCFYAMLGVIASLRLHLIDLGATPQQASAGFAWLMSMALAGKFLFGLVADHLPGPRALLLNLTVMLAGCTLLARMDATGTALATTLLGLGWGGLFTLIQLRAVDQFGLAHAGKLMGVITLVDASLGGLGAWATNALHAGADGGYGLAYRLIVALVALAWLLSAMAARSARPAVRPDRGSG